MEQRPEEGVLQKCSDLNIAFVAYSPLGRGFLTGQIKSFDDLDQNDFRRNTSRFQGENFRKNLELLTKIEELAREKNCTSSQLAIAWVLAQGDNIFPIPGTKRVKYLEENAKALDVSLTKKELDDIEAVFPKGAATGQRYSPEMRKFLNK